MDKTMNLSLSYTDLLKMEMVKKKVILICPGFFVDYVEWEGVPLSEILKKAEIEAGYKKITFHSLDGYSSSFDRKEAENNLLFLAMKVNGEILPKEHGFPVRLVAEDILGGQWVKWVSTIEVN
jgi:DMSO/TMAO reductase YedYZ molybdopterin-dependent catalytic subunit